MKVYKVMKFRCNGWNEWHDEMGIFSSREKAEREFTRLGLKYDPPPGLKFPLYYTDHIAEVEID